MFEFDWYEKQPEFKMRCVNVDDCKKQGHFYKINFLSMMMSSPDKEYQIRRISNSLQWQWHSQNHWTNFPFGINEFIEQQYLINRNLTPIQQILINMGYEI